MSECQCRIILEELACHHQVSRDGIRVRLVEAEQVATNRLVELAGLDLFRQVGLVGTGRSTLGERSAVARARRESTLAATTLRAAAAAIRSTTVTALPTIAAAVVAARRAAVTAVATTGATVAARAVAAGSSVVGSPVAAALFTSRAAVPTVATRGTSVVTVTVSTTGTRSVVARAIVPAAGLTPCPGAVSAARCVTATPFRIVASVGSTISVAVSHNVSFEDNPGNVNENTKGDPIVWVPFRMLCTAVSYSPTPCRVQYHRRWRA